MEIDYHQQSKYSPGKFKIYIDIDGEIIRETNIDEIEEVLRDISFVRHQSANFPFLYGGQFNFERMLTLPYWEYLFIKGDINQRELIDIQDGCLLILALFYVEIYDDCGSSYIYSNQLNNQPDTALNSFKPQTDRQKIIVEKIRFLRKYSEDDKVLRRAAPDENSLKIEKEIQDCNEFLYRELIENYYWETAKSFETLRKESAEQMKKIMDKQKPE